MCICASFTAGITPLPMAPSEIFRERGRKAPMWIFVCEVKVLLHERCVTKRDRMQKIEADFRKPDLLERPVSMAAQVLLGLKCFTGLSKTDTGPISKQVLKIIQRGGLSRTFFLPRLVRGFTAEKFPTLWQQDPT
ncbi:hypothetical protein NPIL_432591 [Nephila pilipes]|uniref:Uncharacterized protein n=1 Tax=Nephila pilipes TaxID=299642 RepID=A0A8X6TF17_NEPPI|nr:hypothetical protein NPIL_432591 [Nephila pilipes]